MSCFVASRSSSNWLHFTGWMGREREDEIRKGEKEERGEEEKRGRGKRGKRKKRRREERVDKR